MAPHALPESEHATGPTQPLNEKELAEELQGWEYINETVPLCDPSFV